MKRYVEQLLEDINLATLSASHRLTSYFSVGECESPVEYEIVNEIDEKDGVRVADLIGLDIFMFPKIEYLNEVEVKELVKEMITLWKVHGLNPIFAKCVPDQVKYCQLREYICEMVFPVMNDEVDIELCDHLPQYCPFAKTCPAVLLASQQACCSHIDYKISC